MASKFSGSSSALDSEKRILDAASMVMRQGYSREDAIRKTSDMALEGGSHIEGVYPRHTAQSRNIAEPSGSVRGNTSSGELKNHTTASKSEAPLQPETAHNRPMTDVTRELLDAKLDSVRAEVRASIAESSKETVAAMGQLNTQMATMQGQMLTEMQGLRADFAHMLKDVTKEMSATGVAVANVGGKVEGLEGKVDGLKSSINMLQFVVGTVVVGGAAIIIGLMQYDLAKNPPPPAAPATVATQPAK